MPPRLFIFFAFVIFAPAAGAFRRHFFADILLLRLYFLIFDA